MSSKPCSIIVAPLAVLLSGGAACAGSTQAAPTASTATSVCTGAMPPALAVPAGNELAFELRAEGVQIYSCDYPSGASGGAEGTPAWALKAPEATLTDERGVDAGKHGAGPSWEALDGSTVLGSKVDAATPDPSSIPWVLLRATSHRGGQGRMSDVTFVQRRETSGGNAPSEGCSASTIGSVARVPYHAVYCFYRGPSPGAYGESTMPSPYGGGRP